MLQSPGPANNMYCDGAMRSIYFFRRPIPSPAARRSSGIPASIIIFLSGASLTTPESVSSRRLRSHHSQRNRLASVSAALSALLGGPGTIALEPGGRRLDVHRLRGGSGRRCRSSPAAMNSGWQSEARIAPPPAHNSQSGKLAPAMLTTGSRLSAASAIIAAAKRHPRRASIVPTSAQSKPDNARPSGQARCQRPRTGAADAANGWLESRPDSGR
jgi:hypothetical protein